MTVGEVLRRATEFLAGKGVESPRLDAEHLLGKALGFSRVELYMHHDRPLDDAERDAYRELIRRRGEREPLAYVLGEWGFRRLTLTTDRRALVPRPETEVVVERCLALLNGGTPRVLDVGTGTGAIALAIADEHPGAKVRALDVSPEALALARENAERTGLEIELVEGDLVGGLGDREYDLVVSNPPYIAQEEIGTLQPEVREWEPRLATVGGGHTAQIAEHALDALVPGGHLVLEVADTRAGAVAELLERLGYEEVAVIEDLAGRDRIVEGKTGVIETAVDALNAGKIVVLPTDTVYGLCVSPYREEPAQKVFELKGRENQQAIALVAGDLEMLFECVPELRGRSGTIARELLPGPYTLVFPNPARRYRWLTGDRPDTIGVRVPILEGYGKQVLDRVGAVAATSANLHGGRDPKTVAEIPQEILNGVAEVVDAGELPGVSSTVIDFTGERPVVLREGAGDVERALAVLA